MAKLDVAIVTVTYNGERGVNDWAEALQRAWERLPSHHRGRLRVVAVDSDSRDGTVAVLRSRAPWVEVIALSSNRGFAAGCNIGLRSVTDSELLVLLNPDVVLDPDFFELLSEQRWPSDLAAVGPCVRTPAGEIEQSARAFPRASTGLWGRTTILTKLFPGLAAAHGLRADPELGRREVDWVSGACMIIPAAALERVGQLDEGYFMYWEDTDWCKRARDEGLRVVFEPALRVRHSQGSSSATRPWGTTVAFHRSAYRYYRAHVAHHPLTRAGAAVLLTLRCLMKLGMLSAKRLSQS